MSIFKRLHDWMGEMTPGPEQQIDGKIPVTLRDPDGAITYTLMSQRDLDFYTMGYGDWVDKYVEQPCLTLPSIR